MYGLKTEQEYDLIVDCSGIRCTRFLIFASFKRRHQLRSIETWYSTQKTHIRSIHSEISGDCLSKVFLSERCVPSTLENTGITRCGVINDITFLMLTIAKLFGTGMLKLVHARSKRYSSHSKERNISMVRLSPYRRKCLINILPSVLFVIR